MSKARIQLASHRKLYKRLDVMRTRPLVVRRKWLKLELAALDAASDYLIAIGAIKTPFRKLDLRKEAEILENPDLVDNSASLDGITPDAVAEVKFMTGFAMEDAYEFALPGLYLKRNNILAFTEAIICGYRKLFVIYCDKLGGVYITKFRNIILYGVASTMDDDPGMHLVEPWEYAGQLPKPLIKLIPSINPDFNLLASSANVQKY